MKKKIVFGILLFLVVAGGVGVLKVKAGINENAWKWLWGGGAEPDSSPPWDGSNTALGLTSLNNSSGGGAISYGVNIPVDGTVTTVPSYAWSENYGWIDFGPASNCTTVAPGVGQYQSANCTSTDGTGANVTMNPVSGDLSGWARIVSVAEASVTGNNGGWSGWIKMKGDIINGGIDVGDYGAVVDTMTGKFCSSSPNVNGTGGGDCFAWSEEIGWVNFENAEIKLPLTFNLLLDGTPGISRNLLRGQTFDPNGHTISWNFLTGSASECTASSDDGSWSGTSLTDPRYLANGSDPVNFGTPNIIYTLSCKDAISGLIVERSVILSSFCRDRSCDEVTDGQCNIDSTTPTFDGDDCSQTCTDNDQCLKSRFNWREIKPE